MGGNMTEMVLDTYSSWKHNLRQNILQFNGNVEKFLVSMKAYELFNQQRLDLALHLQFLSQGIGSDSHASLKLWIKSHKHPVHVRPYWTAAGGSGCPTYRSVYWQIAKIRAGYKPQTYVGHLYTLKEL